MRGKDTTGRFTADYEVDSIHAGIQYDLQNPVGQWVKWYVFAPDATKVDPVYDVGDYDGGRAWQEPHTIPVVEATISQGPQYQNERGFYTLDRMSLVLNAAEAYKALPEMSFEPDSHLRDRVLYRNKLFTPVSVYPKGHIQNQIVTIRVDCVEVKPEEVVNDPQFNLHHTEAEKGVFPGGIQHFRGKVSNPTVQDDMYGVSE